MNASIDEQLAAIVDAAVRPVWAWPSRKRTMREELLAHVATVFEEELGQLDDEHAALAATRERFGATTDLNRQLQASVPLWGGWLPLTDKELLMARWFWLAAIFAVAFGMAILLPAFAAIKQQGVYQVLPLIIGGLITLAGIVTFGYGVVKRLTRAS